jgi:hypothetical protein
MSNEQAAEIIRGLSQTQRVTLQIMVEEQRRGSFAAGVAAVLGANWRNLFARVNGAAMSDDEIRASVYRTVGA